MMSSPHRYAAIDLTPTAPVAVTTSARVRAYRSPNSPASTPESASASATASSRTTSRPTAAPAPAVPTAGPARAVPAAAPGAADPLAAAASCAGVVSVVPWKPVSTQKTAVLAAPSMRRGTCSVPSSVRRAR